MRRRDSNGGQRIHGEKTNRAIKESHKEHNNTQRKDDRITDKTAVQGFRLGKSESNSVLETARKEEKTKKT